ncbi:uncharacterized protein COLE_00859 [Cutaneotrichosporon oleaginosum]|uniref:uncharacterized protein n=1 Tax=Cutaneotrichosporon oleaginosum TaxID=879819 RepID=UPI0013267F77|nr:hypothetical protein COLE_00859 [Cutaneotrichosporon oleaginosum]
MLRALRRMSTQAKTEAAAAVSEARKPTGLVMQIVVRRDLMTHNWPIGPLMAQAAHAASAVQHLHAEHPDMKRYLAGDDGRGWMDMRKALLEVPDEEALQRLHTALEKAGIPHHLWVEEPEHFPTALALVPNKRGKAVKRALDEAGASLWK